MTVLIASILTLTLLAMNTDRSPQPDPIAASEKADELTREGWALWQKRDYSAAAAKFAEAVKLDPGAENAWSGLGWSRFNGGEDRAAAVEAFEKCSAITRSIPRRSTGSGRSRWPRANSPGSENLGCFEAAAHNASAAWWGPDPHLPAGRKLGRSGELGRN